MLINEIISTLRECQDHNCKETDKEGIELEKINHTDAEILKVVLRKN